MYCVFLRKERMPRWSARTKLILAVASGSTLVSLQPAPRVLCLPRR